MRLSKLKRFSQTKITEFSHEIPTRCNRMASPQFHSPEERNLWHMTIDQIVGDFKMKNEKLTFCCFIIYLLLTLVMMKVTVFF